MRCFLKILLLVLLMATIPLQGFTASMHGCDTHERAAPVASPAADVDDADCVHHQADAGTMQHQPGTQDVHGKCGGGCCAASTLASIALPSDAGAPIGSEESIFRSAYFYRLSLAPLQRPPV